MTEENKQELEVVVSGVSADEETEGVLDMLFSDDDSSEEHGEAVDDNTIAGGNEDEGEEGIQPAEEQTTDSAVAEETAQDKLKFVQTSYQKHLELLKQNDVYLYNKIQGHVKAERGQELASALSDEYADDPYSQQIAKGFADLKREQTSQINAEKYVQEYQTANNALEGFVKENNVSQDDLNIAFQAATAMGFDMNSANQNFQIGVPNRAVSYIMERLQSKLKDDYYNGKARTIENETAERIAGVNSVTQPTAGATPQPRKLTQTEKILKSMQEAGPNQSAKNEIFGT